MRVATLWALLLIAASCASAGTGPQATSAALPTEPASERRLFAEVNIALADVPLDEVIFDTFDGGSIALPDATEEQVRRLLNAIPPIDEPVYERAGDSTWLDGGDLVLGYIDDDGGAWAHPHRILNFHEIVNVELAGRPVAVTYCPLCGSGVVFDRRPNDRRHAGVLTFDNSSALYQNDMVMVDAETHTYWWQAAGRGIVGNLTGSELTLLPSMTTTWSAWLTQHPSTMVLAEDQGRGPGAYDRDPFASYSDRLDAGQTPFPVDAAAFDDERLRPSTRIIGLETDGGYVAVPVASNEPAVVRIDASTIVLLDGAGGGSVVAGDVDLRADGSGFVDGDGVRWDAAGRSDDGRRLTMLPSRVAFWFAWLSITGGQTAVIGPDGEIS